MSAMAALFPDLVVNGETVPAAVVAAEAQNHEAPKGKPGVFLFRDQLADLLDSTVGQIHCLLWLGRLD